MAEGKKSFILYCDLIHTVNKLPDEKAGQLLKLILSYTNDLNPVIDDYILELVFEPIKHQLKRDLDGYKKKLEERTWAGILGNLKRWHPDLHEQVLKDELTIQEAYKIYLSRKPSGSDEQRPTESLPLKTVAKIADNVTVNVNDTVTVNERESDIKIKPPQFPNYEKPIQPLVSGSFPTKPTKDELKAYVAEETDIKYLVLDAYVNKIWAHYTTGHEDDPFFYDRDNEVVRNWKQRVKTGWLDKLAVEKFKKDWIKDSGVVVASMPKTRS